MFSAILIILTMPLTDLGKSRGLQFRPLSKFAFFVFVANFLVLMQLGAKHVESPFIEIGQFSTILYFSHFLVIVPLVSLLENSLMEVNLYKHTGKLDFEAHRGKMLKIIKLILSIIISILAIYFFLDICGVFDFIYYNFFNLHYCTDIITESKNLLLEKIAKINANIQYFQEQSIEADKMFKDALRQQLNDDIKNDILTAKKESEINLNSEKKMLKILSERLEKGDFNSSTSSPSVLGKRGTNLGYNLENQEFKYKPIE